MPPAPPPAPVADKLAALIDELGDLEKLLAPLSPKLARHEQLKKLLRTEFASAPGDQGVEVCGLRYIAFLGPKASQRVLDVARLAKSISAKLFFSIATVTLDSVERNVPAEIAAQCISQGPTGSRSLKVFGRSKLA